MGIYLKKLNSVKALEKEKARLLKERAALFDFNISSVRAVASPKDGGGINAENIVSEIVSMLPVSDSVAIVASSVAKMFFQAGSNEVSISGKEQKRRKKKEGQGGKKKDSLLLDLAYEILGGYLKWKALELSYKGVKYMVKKRKEKAEKSDFGE